jgi:3-dehydro-L-gulonate 2-dehydrogenase
MARIPLVQAVDRLARLLLVAGVPTHRARHLAELYVQASADGVYSHGIHMVPNLLRSLRAGEVPDLNSDPKLVSLFGALERYDGNRGLGPLNAEFCIDRAMTLADTHGIGCVALRNTRHWGRPGNCGWRAAERGYLAILWTNTPPNMPAWRGDMQRGDSTDAIGNNPIVFAVPGEDGHHLVLDMAMSQFSFGRLQTLRSDNKQLPVAGGVDSKGNPSTDPAAILDGGHPWPIGFWKGSGLAIVLDAFAAILSDGANSAMLKPGQGDPGVSQVFIAFQPRHLGGKGAAQRTAEIIRDLSEKNPHCRYPGQAALASRRKSETEGVYIRDDVWDELTAQPDN